MNTPYKILIFHCNSILFFKYLIGGKLLYNVVLVSAIQQCKSVRFKYIYIYIYIYLSPPSWDSLPDPIPSLYIITVCQAGLSVLYNNFTLASWTSQVAQW